VASYTALKVEFAVLESCQYGRVIKAVAAPQTHRAESRLPLFIVAEVVCQAQPFRWGLASLHTCFKDWVTCFGNWPITSWQLCGHRVYRIPGKIKEAMQIIRAYTVLGNICGLAQMAKHFEKWSAIEHFAINNNYLTPINLLIPILKANAIFST
jgi:hypothetical protein